jgi:hypothetical protein
MPLSSALALRFLTCLFSTILKNISLYFLPSKMVVPVLNQNLTAIDSYDYLIANKKLSYKPADIIHFSIPDPDNNLLGKATVSSFNHSGFNSPPLAANRK